MNWYLLQTKPNAYMLAGEHLKRQGFEVFSPLIKKTSKRGSKFVQNTVSLFSNYLFIGTELEQIPWKSINATRGVSKTVTFGGNYRPVATNVIEAIKCRCDESGVLQRMCEIGLGDRVKIERGPFADFICNVEKIADSKRVWVLIDMLQRQTRTKVSLSNLSKLS